MDNKDYYKILEIERNASEDDIKKSYRKLALKYHPDRCKDVGTEDKFKEISEAYSVLSSPDKKRTYDVMGNSEDFNFNGEDPFSVFNNIFQQHLSTFMNMKYENEINVDNILNNLSGGKMNSPFSFGNVHIKVHTFSDSDFKNPFDMINNLSNPFDIMNNLSSNLDDDEIEEDMYNKKTSKYSNKSSKNDSNKSSKNNKSIKTKSKTKPEDIIINIDVNFCDIYNEEKKNISVKRNRLRSDGSYSLKTKKFDIPIYGREITIKGEGHQYPHYTESGNIFINISNNLDENFKRLNDYDLLAFHPITIEDISKTFTFELVLPNKKVIIIQYEKDSLKKQKHLFQKIPELGFPYYDEETRITGDLYILYHLSFEESVNKNKILEYQYVAKNCNIDDIFQNNI
jgi:DnaJ-class molecular chaperone